MPIQTMDQLVAGLVAGERIPFYKVVAAGLTSLRWYSLWKAVGCPGAGSTPATGAGAVPTSATAGALPFTNGTNEQYLAQAAMSCSVGGMMMIYDRLCHTSGLSGTVTTAQTVNTTALTRYTTGENVEAWLEWYTSTGSTARTASVSYTSPAAGGTAGRTGSVVLSATMHAGEMVPMSLQAGDTGVKSVESVTLSGSTLTAGDFGVTLLRRLAEVSQPASVNGAEANAFDLGLPEIADSACISAMYFSNSSAPGPWYGQLTIAKD